MAFVSASLDPGSRHTIKCRGCARWSHSDCVGDLRDFTCRLCVPLERVSDKMHQDLAFGSNQQRPPLPPAVYPTPPEGAYSQQPQQQYPMTLSHQSSAGQEGGSSSYAGASQSQSSTVASALSPPGSVGTAHVVPSTPYHPDARTRVNTINQMDPMQPALARLNQDVIAGRNVAKDIARRASISPSTPLKRERSDDTIPMDGMNKRRDTGEGKSMIPPPPIPSPVANASTSSPFPAPMTNGTATPPVAPQLGDPSLAPQNPGSMLRDQQLSAASRDRARQAQIAQMRAGQQGNRQMSPPSNLPGNPGGMNPGGGGPEGAPNAIAGPSGSGNIGGLNIASLPPNVQQLYAFLQNPAHPFTQYMMRNLPGFQQMPVQLQLQKMLQAQAAMQRERQGQGKPNNEPPSNLPGNPGGMNPGGGGPQGAPNAIAGPSGSGNTGGLNIESLLPNVQQLYAFLQNPAHPFTEYMMCNLPGFQQMSVQLQLQNMLQAQAAMQERMRIGQQRMDMRAMNSTLLPGGGGGGMGIGGGGMNGITPQQRQLLLRQQQQRGGGGDGMNTGIGISPQQIAFQQQQQERMRIEQQRMDMLAMNSTLLPGGGGGGMGMGGGGMNSITPQQHQLLLMQQQRRGGGGGGMNTGIGMSPQQMAFQQQQQEHMRMEQQRMGMAAGGGQGGSPPHPGSPMMGNDFPALRSNASIPGIARIARSPSDGGGPPGGMGMPRMGPARMPSGDDFRRMIQQQKQQRRNAGFGVGGPQGQPSQWWQQNQQQ